MRRSTNKEQSKVSTFRFSVVSRSSNFLVVVVEICLFNSLQKKTINNDPTTSAVDADIVVLNEDQRSDLNVVLRLFIEIHVVSILISAM